MVSYLHLINGKKHGDYISVAMVTQKEITTAEGGILEMSCLLT